jgi:hypothetical protein
MRIPFHVRRQVVGHAKSQSCCYPAISIPKVMFNFKILVLLIFLLFLLQPSGRLLRKSSRLDVFVMFWLTRDSALVRQLADGKTNEKKKKQGKKIEDPPSFPLIIFPTVWLSRKWSFNFFFNYFIK